MLRILELRKLDITKTQRKQILECVDAELLEQWFERAVTVARTDELFY